MNIVFRLALAQVNPTAGDITGNAEIIRSNIANARECGADAIVFPELVVSGYPPEDLLVRPSFLRRCEETVHRIAEDVRDITVILGAPVNINGIRNAACVLADGKWAGSILKGELPNYGVFDERRYFIPGDNGPLVKIGGMAVGVSICEDIWVENDILEKQVADGAGLLVNISGSPYRHGVFETRRDIVSNFAKRFGVPVVYCNQVCGQDELVFDGRSFVSDGAGNIIARCEGFREDFMVVDMPVSPEKPIRREVIEISTQPGEKPTAPASERRHITDENEEIYEALTLGVRDYVNKNRFGAVTVALSGGIDSALTATIAVDALGAERVTGVSLPSPYSSQGSIDDARQLAENLGIRFISIPIGPMMASYDEALKDVFAGRQKDIAEENIQARIRGNVMMALSNKFGWLVLTTGNKSEIAVGYCTLYGDMAGGFAVIKDVYKTRVYKLSEWRNKKAGRDIIPRATIEKEPSAELRPDQKDTDSLPPYEILDPILREYIENDKDVDEIVKLGYSIQLVSKIIRMVDVNEYKRRQGPVGVKITSRAFGRDRRLPITCRFC